MCYSKLRSVLTFGIGLVFYATASFADQPSKLSVLTNVANCFHQAVSSLQNEPSPTEQLGEFLSRAKAKLSTSIKGKYSCQVSELKWNSQRTKLLSPDDKEILFRVIDKTHDNYGDRSSWFVTYEFYIPKTEETAKTTVELSM